MADSTFVTDTSALLAFIEKEEGAKRVKEVLTQASIIIPWIVILEVIYITQRELGEEEALIRYALIRQLKATIIWDSDEATLITAARFKASNKLSLADAIIAAIASLNNATLLHKDPEYESLTGQVNMEALPYKAS
jgi:ribonuclease VapC